MIKFLAVFLFISFNANAVNAELFTSAHYEKLRAISPITYEVIYEKYGSYNVTISEIKSFMESEQFIKSYDTKIEGVCALIENERLLICLERYGGLDYKTRG